MSNFRVGQKVVCVDATPSGSVVRGRIYTISGVSITGVGVTLVEAVAAPWAVGFLSRRFRPVAERKTDISIFKAMLTPKHQRVDA